MTPILLINCCFANASIDNIQAKYPFYIGMLGGYGSTTWQGLVPKKANQNAAIIISTPKSVEEGGFFYPVNGLSCSKESIKLSPPGPTKTKKKGQGVQPQSWNLAMSRFQDWGDILVHRKINLYKFVGHSTHSILINKTTKNLLYGVLVPCNRNFWYKFLRKLRGTMLNNLFRNLCCDALAFF